MDRRLPPREGEWIDRSQRITFRFEDEEYTGFAGDVLSSALWANDVRLLGRSFKYHRPRGIYSLAGHDVNVMVEDDRRTNLRGDLLPISEGLDVRSVNTIGGLKRDRLRLTEWFSRLLPVGFYYKAFHTPRWLFPYYEQQMRKVAGLGRVPAVGEHAASPKDYDFCDLLVVGAGPSGMAAAIAAAEHGLDVLLVDEQRRLGGSLAWQRPQQPAAQQMLQGLVEQVTSMDKIRVRCRTQAAGCYADLWVALVDDVRLTKLRARAIVVATGGFEQPAVFRNNDLPGVMLGSAAQRLMHLYAVKPCDRATVFAANAEGYRLALDLHEAGVDVAGVVDPRSEPESSDLADQLQAVGVTTHNGQMIVEAISGAGKTRIRGAGIGAVHAGRASTHIECDGIVTSTGWIPNASLLYQAGARMSYSDRVEQFVPKQLPDGVFATGRVRGVFGLEARIDDGERAGLAAAVWLGQCHESVPEPLTHEGRPPSHPFPIVEHSKGKNFVDQDEDLHLADFLNAHQEGYDNIELMKRFSTFGMGPSQGKLWNMNAVRILARLNGETIDETGTTTSRPFHQPVSIGHLAGRRFHPMRRTPMNDWHIDAGAVMIHAGSWYRPEYYATPGSTRNERVLTEAKNVRDGVGLIDVSSLGKIQMSGPDAVQFLEFLYTGRFAKQRVGTLRYGLACDESGVIIEDGVVARVADDRFYITATSSGAAAFYREMQRWAMIQRRNVTFVNATGHLGAMNLTGPNARDVLQQLTDVDYSADAFPYLAVRDGIVAGVRATLLRVGFVGELGYEIHVPCSQAFHVWSALMAAGESVGIRPFGVEAQRLLRLEKGHLIVGLDTDALTNPFEADVGWALGKDKSGFVGSRALDIVQRKEHTRRLVGLRFDPETSALPEDCHLIIANGKIAGRVTSVVHQSTLGFPIAMAFVHPDLSTAGTAVRIRIDAGREVEARVSAMPFYDPNNTRQAMVASE